MSYYFFKSRAQGSRTHLSLTVTLDSSVALFLLFAALTWRFSHVRSRSVSLRSSGKMADPPMRTCPNDARTLLDLDADALAHCYGFLDIRDISNLSITCKPLARVAYSDCVWNRLFRYLYLLFSDFISF